MANELQRIEPPALPVAKEIYYRVDKQVHDNVLRLFFNRLTAIVNRLTDEHINPTNTFVPYAEFISGVNQTASAIDTPQAITLSATSTSNHVEYGSSSQVSVETTGMYLVSIKLCIDESSSTSATVDIWAKKNGTNIDNSLHSITVGGKMHVNIDTLISLEPTDYIEFWWQTDDTDAYVSYESATGSLPAAPSVVLTVTFVSSV